MFCLYSGTRFVATVFSSLCFCQWRLLLFGLGGELLLTDKRGSFSSEGLEGPENVAAETPSTARLLSQLRAQGSSTSSPLKIRCFSSSGNEFKSSTTATAVSWWRFITEAWRLMMKAANAAVRKIPKKNPARTSNAITTKAIMAMTLAASWSTWTPQLQPEQSNWEPWQQPGKQQ